MKFVKGMFIGGLVTTGIMMMYLENENKAKRKMIKRENSLQKIRSNLELKSKIYYGSITLSMLKHALFAF